jgi:hypothetical protein
MNEVNSEYYLYLFFLPQQKRERQTTDNYQTQSPFGKDGKGGKKSFSPIKGG